MEANQQNGKKPKKKKKQINTHLEFTCLQKSMFEEGIWVTDARHCQWVLKKWTFLLLFELAKHYIILVTTDWGYGDMSEKSGNDLSGE